MLVAQKLTRVFKYNGATLADIGPDMTPEQVKLHHATFYPTLLNAIIEEPIFTDDKVIYTFTGSVGTKG